MNACIHIHKTNACQRSQWTKWGLPCKPENTSRNASRSEAAGSPYLIILINEVDKYVKTVKTVFLNTYIRPGSSGDVLTAGGGDSRPVDLDRDSIDIKFPSSLRANQPRGRV